jgi:hypothetical protein
MAAEYFALVIPQKFPKQFIVRNSLVSRVYKELPAKRRSQEKRLLATGVAISLK